MPTYDLKAALQKLQQKPQNFALYRGEEGDQVFISARPPTSKQLAEIEKETGDGKRILKGICFCEPAGIVFATRNAAAPAWAKMIEKVLKEKKCSQFLPLSLRQLAPGDPEEASGEDQKTAISTSSSGDSFRQQADWERLKTFLMPHLRAGLAAPESKDKVLKVVLAAQASEKAGDYAAASTIFQRLAAVLSLPLPPPVEIKPPKAGKLQAALNKLAPVFKLALQAHPERKTEILRPVVQFQKQLKDGSVEEARDTLRELGQTLRATLRPAA